jgi:membrane-associated phospholipid phosphatase
MSVLAQAARGPRSRALLYAVGAYVPLSRVYVGVHYPTDVVGGAGMGLVLSALWRGPLAVANRALVAAGVAGLRRAVPPLLRLGAWAGLGLRPRRRAPRQPLRRLAVVG